MKGDEVVVELLLEHKADINKKDSYGRMALHQALRHKADVNLKDDYGATALCWSPSAAQFFCQTA
jgi:ankyrin repeat protein